MTRRAAAALLAYLQIATSLIARHGPHPQHRRTRHTTSSLTMSEYEGRRVVVTGMGIVSCLGNTLEDVSKSLHTCTPGITFSEKYEEIGMKSKVRGRPDINVDEYIDRKQARFMGVNARYAFIAMQKAVEDSGLSPEVINSPRVGGILGQGGTSIADIEETLNAVSDKKLRRVGPYRVTRSMGSTVSAVLATAFKLQGVSYSISSACSTGAHCIGVGMEQIQLGKQDICFCGAGEAEDWGFSVMFDAMGALSTKYNDNPTTASRAFDVSRDGFVIAGGGGIVVLEELEHAKARGAKIYAELVGYGANSDGYDMVAPSGEGGQRCMKMAMEMADRLGGEKQVGYVNTHGTSTPVGDTAELSAIKTVFTEMGYQPFIGSTKSLSGHALGAAGVHEAIYCMLMMRDGFLAESANINELVEEAEGMNILTSRHDGQVDRILSNSFGFGGTNACLVFDKYTDA
uniref:Nodulation protein E n=1 Tax=Haptolina ericina TaxID=156174 RepID=A0A7S3EWS5_9EUKA